MRTVGVFEAKAKLSELIERVVHGEEITITNHGQPVAKLVSVRPPDLEQMRQLIEETRQLRRTIKIGRISLRKIIEKGRH
jgi:prevent-host-death family protein